MVTSFEHIKSESVGSSEHDAISSVSFEQVLRGTSQASLIAITIVLTNHGV